MKHAPSFVVVVHKAFSHCTYVFAFFFPKTLTTLHSEFIILLFFLTQFWKQRRRRKKNRAEYGHVSLFSQYDIVHLFINLFVSSSAVFLFLLQQKGSFYFPGDVCRGPNQWQIFRPSLVFTRTPRCFCEAVGAESSFRPWSLWTGSVALIAQVIDQIKESTVIPLSELRDSCHRLKVGGRQGYVSVQSVYQYSLYLSCHFGGSCCFILRSPETCIKLY